MILNNTISDRVGLYLRLSREDGDKSESDSIHSQRDLIMDFISRNHAFRFRREYVDDGYSGSNFDRPAFVRMMDDARKGVINCIMVKDLSRFGRNYIETGRYLEQIFPSMGLRLVAINDNYDTFDSDSSDNAIVMPIKNLINDSYCRDISLKIRSHLDVKRRAGQFIGSFAMFGYEKNPENKNQLIIDEDAARTVEMIFQFKLNGMSSQRIADKLNELGIHPPYQYKRQKGFNYNSGFKSARDAKWTRETVTRMLNCEMYTGTMVQGKYKRINYRIKKSVPIAPQDWIRVENTHPPIIQKTTFDLVQDLRGHDTRVAPGHETVYPLGGYVKCGCCGQSMVRRSTTRCGKKYRYYHCSTYKAGGNCTAHLINCEKVEQIVLEALRHRIELLDKAERMITYITKNKEDRSGLRVVGVQIEKLKNEIDHYGALKAKLYRDMVEGLVDRKEFDEINGRFDASRSKAEDTLRSLEQKEQVLLNNQWRFQPWVENLKLYNNLSELSRSVVVSTIESVVINNAKEIEVHFKFEEELNEIFRFVEGEEAVENDCGKLHEKEC